MPTTSHNVALQKTILTGMHKTELYWNCRNAGLDITSQFKIANVWIQDNASEERDDREGEPATEERENPAECHPSVSLRGDYHQHRGNGRNQQQ